MNPVFIGAVLSAFSVILGAFGTHGLRGKLTFDLMQAYETGTHYLFMHALATILYGIWRQANPQIKTKEWPALCFLVGSFLFTGSLYAIVFTSIRALGIITPFGGMLYIAGWGIFAKQARDAAKVKSLPPESHIKAIS